MLIKNMDDQQGLVNGAIGHVLGFFAALHGGNNKSEGMIRNVKLLQDGKSMVFAQMSDSKQNVVKPLTKREGDKSATDMELFPLVEFLTLMGGEVALVTHDEVQVKDNEGNVLTWRV